MNMETTLKVQVFAVLRDYFPSPISIVLPEKATAKMVLDELSKLRPEAAGIIRKCRVALTDTILDHGALVGENGEIYILPPSSGG